MIKVTIVCSAVETISEFTVSGHAQYAEKGEDIVCAGVSAVSFGTINAIHELLNIKLTIEMEEETGFLHCVIPEIQNQDTHEKVQLLLAGMVVALDSIASQYGEFVTINKI